jgi:hypothetical protein
VFVHGVNVSQESILKLRTFPVARASIVKSDGSDVLGSNQAGEAEDEGVESDKALGLGISELPKMKGRASIIQNVAVVDHCASFVSVSSEEAAQKRGNIGLLHTVSENRPNNDFAEGITYRALRCVKQSLVCRHKHVYYYNYGNIKMTS